MKCKTLKEGFHPITVSITIESKDELKYLWCLANTPASEVRNCSSYNKTMSNYKYDTLDLFHMIDDIAIKNGLKKDK